MASEINSEKPVEKLPVVDKTGSEMRGERKKIVVYEDLSKE